ncbi:MAG TPA: hypothetical protein VMR52_11175 [Dehalococcoidia bacterium]|nr:hypothetical protein [Dehalococcoidia bacterium]
MGKLKAGLLVALLALFLACGSDEEPPLGTTLEETVAVDLEGNLVLGPGEEYTVRTELAQAQAGRDRGRRSLVVFHQLTDFHIVDEESPLRSEWLDACPSTVSTGAFRPQESLSLHVADSLIGQANSIDRSPVTGRDVDFAIHTGNATDNAQFNELRWFIDLMDGVPVSPESGAVGYQGVQTGSPAQAYKSLLNDAQQAFIPEGISYPWYAVAGNHDVATQGRYPISDDANRIATGAAKVISVGPAAQEQACALQNALPPGVTSEVTSDPQTVVRGVGSDGNRRLLSLRDWIGEHFASETSRGPLGHGFTESGVEDGEAYYTFERGNIAFIVLNSAVPTGFPSGSIDRPQYDWLEGELAARSSSYIDGAGQAVTTQNRDQLVVVVSHHPTGVMTNPFPSVDGTERVLGAQVETLLHRFPNVVLHVAGHTGRNSVSAKPNPSGSGGYWEVTTGSALDYPLQGRLMEVVDNRDGTLSIFTTMYNAAVTLNPGDANDPTPDDRLNQRVFAGVARQVAYADPHADPAGIGLAVSDRNAELLMPAPFDLSAVPPPTQGLPD